MENKHCKHCQKVLNKHKIDFCSKECKDKNNEEPSMLEGYLNILNAPTLDGIILIYIGSDVKEEGITFGTCMDELKELFYIKPLRNHIDQYFLNGGFKVKAVLIKDTNKKELILT